MHCLIGFSHLAKYCRNRPLIVWEMLTNVQKSPIPQWWRKWKSDPKSTCGSGLPQQLISFRESALSDACQVWSTFNCVSELSCSQNDRQNDHINICLAGGGIQENLQCLARKASQADPELCIYKHCCDTTEMGHKTRFRCCSQDRQTNPQTEPQRHAL